MTFQNFLVLGLTNPLKFKVLLNINHVFVINLHEICRLRVLAFTIY